MNRDKHTEKATTGVENPEAETNGEELDNLSFLNMDESPADDPVTLLEQERARSEELTDQVQRVQAELINYRRRTELEYERVKARAAEAAISKILPVADDLHRAIASLPSDVEGNGWAEGFRLIEANLQRALESQGVRPMETIGTPFDPALHEAVVFDENTSGEHMVVEEFQRGYMINDKVLRPAMVKVGSIPADDSNDK